jgi:hypothetical protein
MGIKDASIAELLIGGSTSPVDKVQSPLLRLHMTVDKFFKSPIESSK